MNFLAHLLLADATPASRIGNLLPDLMRVRSDTPLAPGVADGVANHRRVDAFTDTHPVFARSKARVFPAVGRYSGIVVDVLYDHCLSLEWPRYGLMPLPAFVASVYEDFHHHPHLMPEDVQPVLSAIASQDWLLSYGTRDGLRLCFRRMSHRFSTRFGREVSLTSAVDVLDEHSEALRDDFNVFFPELLAFVQKPRDGMAANREA